MLYKGEKEKAGLGKNFRPLRTICLGWAVQQ